MHALGLELEIGRTLYGTCLAVAAIKHIDLVFMKEGRKVTLVFMK